MISQTTVYQIVFLVVLTICLFTVIYTLTRKKMSILKRILIAFGVIVISGIILFVIAVMGYFSVGNWQ